MRYSTEELVKNGIFDERSVQVCLNAADTSNGIIITGPAGAGKTTLLNWFKDEIQKNMDPIENIAVWQRAGELYPINESDSVLILSYDDNKNEPLIKNFINNMDLCSINPSAIFIDDARGTEIFWAMVLAASGIRPICTLHKRKCDFQKYIEELVKEIKHFDPVTKILRQDPPEETRGKLAFINTHIFIDNFKVQEIYEIEKYDDKAASFISRCIYRRSINHETNIDSECLSYM